MQAQAREREEKLSLAEYELRLAKEDLAEMHKRLEQVGHDSSPLCPLQNLTTKPPPSRSASKPPSKPRSCSGSGSISPPPLAHPRLKAQRLLTPASIGERPGFHLATPGSTPPQTPVAVVQAVVDSLPSSGRCCPPNLLTTTLR